MRKITTILVLCLVFLPSIYSGTIGSWESFKQDPVVFNGTSNIIRGLVYFDEGFSFSNSVVECTFDGALPLKGPIDMRRGKLVLNQDIIFNNDTRIDSIGSIYGNGHIVNLPESVNKINCSKELPFLNLIDEKVLSKNVNNVAWSVDGRFIACMSDEDRRGEELNIYSFEDGKLVFNDSVSIPSFGYALAWHSSSQYIVAGRQGRKKELRLYRFNSDSGEIGDYISFEQKGSINTFSWNPQFKDYLTVCADHTSSSAGELIIYLLQKGENPSLIKKFGVNIDHDVTSASWSSDGKYLAVGCSSGLEFRIFSFDEANFYEVASLQTGHSISSVSWKGGSSYIACGLGLGASSQRLRVYNFDSETKQLSEYLSARTNESSIVYSIDWAADENCLAVGKSYGCDTEVSVYKFDETKKTLSLICSKQKDDSVNSVCWNHDGTFFVIGDDGCSLSVYEAETETNKDIVFDNVKLFLHSDVDLTDSIILKGSCVINGGCLNLANGGALVIAEDSSLNLKNTVIKGLGSVGDGQIIFSADNSSLYLSQAMLGFSNDVTTNIGKIYVNNVSTILSNDFDWTLKDDALLTIDGTTLKIESFSNNKLKTIFYDEGCLFLVNSGTIKRTESSEDLMPYINELDSRVNTAESEIDNLALEITSTYLTFAKVCTDIDVSSFRGEPGDLVLQHDLYFEDGRKIIGTGVIDLKNKEIVFGREFLEWDNDLTWVGNNGSIELKEDSSLFNQWAFEGTVIVDGNGHELLLKEGSRFVIKKNSTLKIQNMILSDINNHEIVCEDDTSKIILKNVTWLQNEDKIFTKGSLEFKKYVEMDGNYSFAYQSNMPCIIDKTTQLVLNRGFTLCFDNESENLITFVDDTSELVLKGAGLHANSAGLCLKNGKLTVKKSCTLSSDLGKGISIGNGNLEDDFSCDILSRGVLNITSGIVNYENVSGASWNMSNKTSFLSINNGATFNLNYPLHIGNGIMTLSKDCLVRRKKTAKLTGEIWGTGIKNYVMKD
jgi:WD40 repeat protein